jgi:hypothetical protein
MKYKVNEYLAVNSRIIAVDYEKNLYTLMVGDQRFKIRGDLLEKFSGRNPGTWFEISEKMYYELQSTGSRPGLLYYLGKDFLFETRQVGEIVKTKIRNGAFIALVMMKPNESCMPEKLYVLTPIRS